MFCHVFYYFAASGEQVPSSRPLDLPPGQVWHSLVSCLETDDDYVGLVDASDNVLQITRGPAQDSYRVELPLPDERASWERAMSGAEVRELLGRLPATFRPLNFPGFERQPW